MADAAELILGCRDEQAKKQLAEKQFESLQELQELHNKTDISPYCYSDLKVAILFRLKEMDQRIKDAEPYNEMPSYVTWSPHAKKPTIEDLLEEAISSPECVLLIENLHGKVLDHDQTWSVANFVKQYQCSEYASVSTLVEHLPVPCSLYAMADMMSSSNTRLEPQISPWGNKFINMTCEESFVLTLPNSKCEILTNYFLNSMVIYQVSGTRLWISWPSNEHNDEWRLKSKQAKDNFSLEGWVRQLTDLHVNVTSEGTTMLIPPGTMFVEQSHTRSALLVYSIVPKPTKDTPEEVKKVVQFLIKMCKLREEEEGEDERDSIVDSFECEFLNWKKALKKKDDLSVEQLEWLRMAIEEIELAWWPYKSSLKKRKHEDDSYDSCV